MAGQHNSVAEENLKSLCLYNEKIILSVDSKIVQGYLTALAKNYGINHRLLKNTFISIEEILPDIHIDELVGRNIDPIDLLGQILTDSVINSFLQDYADKQNISLETLLQEINTNSSYKYGYYKNVGYQINSLLASLLLYNKVNSKISCSLTSFSKAENFAIQSYITYNNVKEGQTSSNNLHDEINYLLPSISSLNWNELFEIRHDGRIKAFRTWVNNKKNEILSEGVESVLIKELWNTFKELKPNLYANSAKAIIGNFPLPIPVNPFSIASSIYDISKNIKFQKDYSWLFFIFDTRNKII